MFERYTEKARRVIFHARYEAIQYGSPNIETEHLLLGLLREAREIVMLLPRDSDVSIRNQIDASTIAYKKGVSVDLPLSNESKRVLAYGAEEAERLAHRHIGTEHLLLGLLREKDSFGARMLSERGLVLYQLRETIAKTATSARPAFSTSQSALRKESRLKSESMVEIHGWSQITDHIRDRVNAYRKAKWHWHEQEFRPRDIVVHQDDGRISFDLSLAKEPTKFALDQNGWAMDYCVICRWELMESSEPQHARGFTNGRDWVCSECYDKFLQGPDYFATSHPENT